MFASVESVVALVLVQAHLEVLVPWGIKFRAQLVNSGRRKLDLLGSGASVARHISIFVSRESLFGVGSITIAMRME